MKSYTDIEQSKKLAEILPIESADMHYSKDFDGSWFVDLAKYTSVKIPKYVGNIEEHLLPCWSLGALLDALPTKLQIVLAINDYQGDRKEKYVIGSVEHDKYDCFADNPIDACYEMIIKLYEQNIL